MIKEFNIQNFGPITSACCKNAGMINLAIGPNGSGKTFLLKSLYVAIRTSELYGRGKNNRKDSEILFDKMYWTFQIDQLGKLVKSGCRMAEFEFSKGNNQQFAYSFGTSTERQVKVKLNTCSPVSSNSVFLPAKEVLSLLNIILRSRDVDKEFGFDDTYFDLAKALSIHPTRGKNYPEFSHSRTILEESLGGRLTYDDTGKEWVFKQGNKIYSISATSEGIKKMSILDTLLGNHYLKKGAVVFIDEPEAALHPSLISTFMDIIATLTRAGIQFFIASHSYFVIKKLYLIAHQQRLHIPVISFTNNDVTYSDLLDEMPENSIIDESIRLYLEEINL